MGLSLQHQEQGQRPELLNEIRRVIMLGPDWEITEIVVNHCDPVLIENELPPWKEQLKP
jgi:hypothetical protein